MYSAARTFPVPADAAAFTLLKEQLVEVLGTLTEREQMVLRLRFGLDDGRARTLEEVGKEFDVTSGGGAITVTMTGKKMIKAIKISPDVLDKEDVEMLEDLVMTAVNEGIKKAESLMEEEMKKFNIPTGLNSLL